MSEFIPSTITEYYKLVDVKEDVLEVSSFDMQSPVTTTGYKSVHNLHTLCDNIGACCVVLCEKMQVMPRVNHPAMCYCNTRTRSSLSCLLAFYTIPVFHIFLIRRIFYLLVSFLFFLHNCAQVLVQKCIRFSGKRTRHRQVIDINNINNFLLPEAVCCCLQTCNFCFD